MRFGRLARGQTLVESVVARAQAFPPRDYRRWQILGELATTDFKAAFDRACALIRTTEPAAMVLGAEMCDQLFIGLREGRRFTHQAAELLRPLCGPTQDPEVLAAALPPYLQVCPEAQPLLYELLDHPDAQVRRTVAQLVAAAGAEFAEDRQVDSLIALLDRDTDQGVREQAAESLELILACYPYVSQSLRIVAALAERQEDPSPRIRAASLAGMSATDVGTTLKRLVAELAAVPQPVWQFVDCFNRLPPFNDGAGDRDRDRDRDSDGGDAAGLCGQAHVALRRLQAEGWPQQADPSRFPVASERADMLARALAVTAPEREGVPMERRRRARP